MQSEWRERLEHWILTLQKDFYKPLGNFAFSGFTTFDQLTPEEAEEHEKIPFPQGMSWGQEWEYAWLWAEAVLPPEAQGQRIVMDLNPGGESTIFVNGAVFGTRRAEWVSTPHHYLVDQTLTRAGQPGDRFRVLLETYAGHFFPESAAMRGCSTGPVLPGDYQPPNPQAPWATVGRNTFGIWNEDAYQLWLDVTTLQGLLTEGDPDSLRAEKVEAALKAFTLRVDFEQPLEGRLADYRGAREILRPALEARNGSTAPTLYAIGNAHLDVAWLWPIAETERKTARTFAQQLRLLEEYPEYKFLQSQPETYRMCKERYPELYERVRAAIKRGQWIADGAMWLEPDTNMPSGEALIRQLVHGKRFYQEELGVDCRLVWLPDTFGYSAALPQIFKGCGIDHLTTQKIFWTYNDSDRFPYHYFSWEGMDGSEITAFLHMTYTAKTDTASNMRTWKDRVQRHGLDSFLLPYGYGDGGGGPTRDDVEQILRQVDLEGAPRVRSESPATFFKEMEKDGAPDNRYVGELYFQCHRGTYTSQALIKRGNRKTEIALREAELWSAAAKALAKKPYPAEALDSLWKNILLNQFHDILPGSSIARVYTEANLLYAKTLADAAECMDQAQMALTENAEDAITLFNSLSWEREALVPLPEAFAQGAKTTAGVLCPAQATEGGALVSVQLPACGWVTLTPAPAPVRAAVSMAEKDGLWLLENECLQVSVNAQGELVSVVDKATGAQRISGLANRFTMYKDVPRKFDAWDIDSMAELSPVALNDVAEIEIAQEGPLCCALRVRKALHHSTLEQVISLSAGSSRIDFDSTVQWNELHRLLKVEFPTGIHAEQGINEIQFGYVNRPTHRSRPYDADRFEVCNHRYTALCDATHGAAVLNDCKYGVSMLGDTIGLTLLRAAACPEMRADNGEHHFVYSYYVWNGSFESCQVVREGYALNVPPVSRPGCGGEASLFTVDKPAVILETVKCAEDGSGDIILRLYESKHGATTTTLHTTLPVQSAQLCDMLESPLEDVPIANGSLALALRAFEVKTLRLKL